MSWLEQRALTVSAIKYSAQNGRANIVIDRPDKRNALTDDMVQEILRCVRIAGADDTVKVVVISAVGPMFTSGFDISNEESFAGSPKDPVRARISSVREKADWMLDLLHAGKPTVMQVQGRASGSAR